VEEAFAHVRSDMEAYHLPLDADWDHT